MFEAIKSNIKLVTTDFVDGHADHKIAYQGDTPAAYEENKKLYIMSYDPNGTLPPKVSDRPMSVVKDFKISDWDGEIPPRSNIDDCSPFVISEMDASTIEKVFKIIESAASHSEPASSLSVLADEFKNIEYEYEPLRRFAAGFRHQADKISDKTTA